MLMFVTQCIKYFQNNTFSFNDTCKNNKQPNVRQQELLRVQSATEFSSCFIERHNSFFRLLLSHAQKTSERCTDYTNKITEVISNMLNNLYIGLRV